MVQWQREGGKRAGEKAALGQAGQVEDVLERLNDPQLIAQVTTMLEQFELYYDGDDAYDDLTFRSAGLELASDCSDAGYP